MSDHPRHVWHAHADGWVRCGHKGCADEPSAVEAERARAERATAARMRYTIAYGTHRRG